MVLIKVCSYQIQVNDRFILYTFNLQTEEVFNEERSTKFLAVDASPEKQQLSTLSPECDFYIRTLRPGTSPTLSMRI